MAAIKATAATTSPADGLLGGLSGRVLATDEGDGTARGEVRLGTAREGVLVGVGRGDGVSVTLGRGAGVPEGVADR